MTGATAREILQGYDQSALRLADRLEQLVRCPATPARHRAISRLRAQLCELFDDHQMLSESAGVHAPSRSWLRRAVAQASTVALPGLIRVIREELSIARPTVGAELHPEGSSA